MRDCLKKNEQGLTLIEMMIALSIITLMVGVISGALANYLRTTAAARNTVEITSAHEKVLHQIRSELRQSSSNRSSQQQWWIEDGGATLRLRKLTGFALDAGGGPVLSWSSDIVYTLDAEGFCRTHETVNLRADSVPGVGTQVYGFMSSTEPFYFSGNAQQETVFYEGFADDLGTDGWIELPDVTELPKYKNYSGAHGAGSERLWAGTSGKELRQGPQGFSVTGNVDTHIELIYDQPTATQSVKFTIRDPYGALLHEGTYQMPASTIIHVEQTIVGIRGELHDAATIVSEKQDINISADIYYVDDEGDHPMVFDPDNPANENYVKNEDYQGNAVLGLIACDDVLYTGAEDNANLEVNAALMAVEGSVRWGGSGNRDHLRIFGARISHERTYRYSGSSGYNNSGVYYYDGNLRTKAPPKFLSIEKILLIGFQVVK